MSTDNSLIYDIRIDDYQRSVISSALLTYICEGGFQGRSSKGELEEAQALLNCISNQNGELEQGVINDLQPEG